MAHDHHAAHRLRWPLILAHVLNLDRHLTFLLHALDLLIGHRYYEHLTHGCIQDAWQQRGGCRECGNCSLAGRWHGSLNDGQAAVLGQQVRIDQVHHRGRHLLQQPLRPETEQRVTIQLSVPLTCSTLAVYVYFSGDSGSTSVS